MLAITKLLNRTIATLPQGTSIIIKTHPSFALRGYGGQAHNAKFRITAQRTTNNAMHNLLSSPQISQSVIVSDSTLITWGYHSTAAAKAAAMEQNNINFNLFPLFSYSPWLCPIAT